MGTYLYSLRVYSFKRTFASSPLAAIVCPGSFTRSWIKDEFFTLAPVISYFRDNAVAWYLHVLHSRSDTRNGSLFLIRGTNRSAICGSAYVPSSYPGEESARLTYSCLGEDSDILYDWKSTFSEQYRAHISPTLRDFADPTTVKRTSLPNHFCFGVAPLSLRIDKTAWKRYVPPNENSKHSADTSTDAVTQSSLLSPRLRAIFRSCMCGDFIPCPTY